MMNTGRVFAVSAATDFSAIRKTQLAMPLIIRPFNGLIIKNDGQIKIKERNTAIQSSSSLLIVTFLRG
jgi:hypothetical protein